MDPAFPHFLLPYIYPATSLTSGGGGSLGNRSRSRSILLADVTSFKEIGDRLDLIMTGQGMLLVEHDLRRAVVSDLS